MVVEPGHVDATLRTEYVHALTGATVELRCTELTDSRSSHAGDVHWLRDDVPLTDTGGSRRFQFPADDALDIVDVRLDDAGQYTCHDDVRRKNFVVQVIGRKAIG